MTIGEANNSVDTWYIGLSKEIADMQIPDSLSVAIEESERERAEWRKKRKVIAEELCKITAATIEERKVSDGNGCQV